MNLRILIALLAVSLFLTACQKKAATTTGTPVEIKMVDRKYNDWARLIGGMSQEEGSLFTNFAASEQYKKYSAGFSSNWAEIDDKRLSKMRTWAITELADENAEKREIFYPFSGPDFLHCFTLFPRGKHYTFVALEPVGNYQELSGAGESNMTSYLNSVETALHDIFKRSYFITFNMDKQLRRAQVDGATPLLCLFIVRTGNRIIDLKSVGLDKDGNLIYETETTKLGKGRVGVQIDFTTSAEPNELKSVVYFSANLGDDPYQGLESFKVNAGLKAHFGKLENTVTYVKSASYLMHYAGFSAIRNVVLDKTAFLVQDDTGVPVKYLDKKKWKIQLYGKYVKPVNDFSGVEQDDLKALYSRDPSVKAIPFSLGYHWYTEKQNLLVAKKTELKEEKK